LLGHEIFFTAENAENAEEEKREKRFYLMIANPLASELFISLFSQSAFSAPSAV